MRSELVSVLLCPRDGSFPLELETAEVVDGEILRGHLLCSSCGSVYPIEDGIPRMLDLDGDETAEMKQQDIALRDSILKEREGAPPVLGVDRLPELDAIRRLLGPCGGLRALDAGCGEGGMTPALEGAGHVTGVDFCRAALLRVGRPLLAPLELLQGDVCRMPLRDAQFDVAISSQVIEHVPSPEHRKRFLAELARTLKPGGRLVITAYNWPLDARREGQPREGFHSGHIYFHCYDAEEFHQELSDWFDVKLIRGVQVILPRTWRLFHALGRKNIYWDRFWQTRRAGLEYGRLLLAVCRRRYDTQMRPAAPKLAVVAGRARSASA